MIRHLPLFTALLLVSCSVLLGQNPPAATFNVRDYGAVGDGTTLETAAIQSAVDSISASGGGKLVFPPGTYLTSSIHVKNNVTLHIEEFATVLGSPLWTGYQKTNFHALLLAEGQDNIGISGRGTINGNGVLLAADTQRLANEGVIPNAEESYRPLIISFRNCTHVTVRDITLRDSAMWVQDYRQCEDLLIENITVRSNVVRNNDGLDITDCKRVVVRGCDIDSEDDGICPKSSSSSRMCEDMLIENCRIRSSCNALKFGTASLGGFKNVTVRNIEIYETYTSGIALEIVDGGTMENISISNINMTGTNNPLFIRLGNRNSPGAPGIVRGISVSHLTAEIPNRPTGATSPYFDNYNHFGQEMLTGMIVGIPGSPIQDVRLSDITFIHGGIGATPGAKHVLLDNLTSVPEQITNYPDANRFGVVPAWGLYLRHAENIQLENVTFQVKSGGTDYRAAVVCDDVLDLSLDRVNVLSAGTEAIVALHNVQGANITNSVAPPDAVQFVRQMGPTTGVVIDSTTTSFAGPGASGITDNSAEISTTLLGTAAEVTLFWKQGANAPEQLTGWDGSLSDPGVTVSPIAVTRTINGLLPDTLYSCIFRATDAASSVAWSAPLTFLTAFSTAQVPVFSSPVVGASSVSLNWQDNTATETDFILQRSKLPTGPFATIANLAANATAYVDTSLLPFGSYTYRLAATNSENGNTTDFAAAQTSVTFTAAGSQTETFNTPGTIDWVCPPRVSQVIVECRGGGGAGGSAKHTGTSSQARAGGGAGGSYALKVNLPVVAGTTYKVIVGAGGVPVPAVTFHDFTDPVQNGGDSRFMNSSMTSDYARAVGGLGGRNVLKTSGSSPVNVAGGVGSVIGWTGDAVYPGGNGGNAGATSVGGTGAGGGGGGAGDAVPGGSPVFAITGGMGGANGGGNGGTARGANGPIQSTAGIPGGGGGAVVADGGKENFGGAGARGEVKLTYVPQLPPLVWQGGVSGNVWDTSALNWTIPPSPTAIAFIPARAVVFNDTSSHLDVEITGTVAPESITVDSTYHYTFSSTSGGVIGGNGSLTKSGSGTLTTINSSSGDITVNGGALALTTANPNNDASTLTIAATGATLNLAYSGTDRVLALIIGSHPPLANGVYGKVGSVSPIIGIPQILGNGTLTVGPAPFSGWAGAGVNFEDDTNDDGVENGLAWFLGAASPGDNAAGLLPKPTRNAGGLRVEFDCLNGTDRGTCIFELQFCDNLGHTSAWTGSVVPAATGSFSVGFVNFVVTDPEPVGGLLRVVATISASEAPDGRLFCRIRGVD